MKKIISVLLLIFAISFACVSCGNVNKEDDDPINSEEGKNNNKTETTPGFSKGITYTVNLDGETCSIIGIGSCTDKQINIPETIDGYTVEHIKSRAFQNCDSITKVTIPRTVVSIGEYAFDDCNNLLSVNFEKNSNLNSFGKWSFQGCNNLANITIPESVTKIGERAFQNCDSFSSITIPKSVITIEKDAFCVCNNLVSVTFEENSYIESIGNDAFLGCYKLVEVINKSSLDIELGSDDYGRVAYYAKEVHSGQSKIKNVDDCLFYTHDNTNYLLGYIGNNTQLILPEYYNGENYEIYAYAFSYNLKIFSISIPNSITSIPHSAFYGCATLNSITIPDSIIYIGKEAFCYCYNLTSITIPNNVASIGEDAFSLCYKLVEVVNKSSLPITIDSYGYGEITAYAKEVHNGESKIVNKDNYLFYTYDNVNYLIGYVGKNSVLTLPENYNGENYIINEYAFFNCNNLTKLTISNGITKIGEKAFWGCSNLTSATIGSNVASIDFQAFYYCSKLTDLYYRGTEEQWKAISIDNGNDDLTSANIHYNYTE